MPIFRIHRMKDGPRQTFRWAPHVSGAVQVKQREYEMAQGEEPRAIEARNEYAAWAILREREEALGVGDLLETERGELRICKYVGFEDATWLVAEPAAAAHAEPETVHG